MSGVKCSGVKIDVAFIGFQGGQGFKAVWIKFAGGFSIEICFVIELYVSPVLLLILAVVCNDSCIKIIAFATFRDDNAATHIPVNRYLIIDPGSVQFRHSY